MALQSFLLSYTGLDGLTVMFTKLLHLVNGLYEMLVTPAGIVTLVRLVHELNAKPPILVTLLGIVMLDRFVQFEKA